MADNVAITAGTGTTVAADDIGGGVLAQRVKVVLGPDGTGNDALAGAGVNGTGVQRVTIATDQGVITTQLPATLGSKADAASMAVSQSTEDKVIFAATNTKLDTLHTDITATNTQLPTTIGPTTKSASMSVTGATDDPAALGIGGTADAAATAGSTGSISAKLRTLTGQLPATSGGSVQLTITRPANATAYTAGDCIGAAAAALTFATGMTSGQRVMIAGVDFEYDVAALPAGMTTCRLYLYSVTPPSAIADNAAWDLPSGDRASFLGYVDLGQLVDLGSTLFVQTDNVNKAIQLSGSANVFAYLVTTAGFTPAGNSEVLRVRLQLLGL